MGPIPKSGPEYAAYMTTVYDKVRVAGLPNYQGACLWLPSNPHFRKFEALAHIEDATRLINFLRFSCPVGY